MGTLQLDAKSPAEIAYDWAGTQLEDAYIISTANNEGKARDLVTIVGQLDRMQCLPDGAEAIIPNHKQPLHCPWGTANMYQVLKHAIEGVSSAPKVSEPAPDTTDAAAPENPPHPGPADQKTAPDKAHRP